MKKLLHKSLRLLLWFAMLGFVAPLSVVAADCYIAGSFNGWNASATKLTQNGDQYELTQKFDGGTQFKIVYNGNWYGYDAVKGGTDLVTSADGSNKNIQFNSTECYGLFFKNNGELYITKRDDCPQAYSLWGFDILYQEGDTKKWASTKGSAEAWDGNFISTSGDNEVYDMGVIKRGARFIGFRFYTNENGSSVDGANVIWKNLTDEHDAIEGSNYGKWSSNGSQSGTHGGTDEVWHETGCKNKFLGYDNGTYSFYLIFELKVNGSEKALVRTITVNYTINEFDLTTDLQGPAYVGDVVNLTVSGGTAPYTWQQSDDEVSWSTLSGASGTTYAHKVVDKTFIRVVDADGKITNVVEIAPSIKCDPANTIVVFKEDFGTLPDVDARASYSKQNVAVPGTTITYSASVPYTAETTSCAAMTNEGYYSVLANPRNAGCGTNVNQGVTNCNCYNSSERWYRVTEDHTPGDTNGGMLMYNCADGTSKTDVLYECTIDGICANTYINFSAFVTCANTGRSGNIPIEAEFKLFNADTGAELSTSPVTNIGLSEEWKEISAMFNSADATRVKIQLINKADAGQGNDLLFDDMMLSVCTPEADLVCSDLTSTEKTIVRGESETLTAEILSGIMSNPFYLWQYRTNKSNWLPLGDPQQNLENLTVTPETTPTYYRVILANTAQEALNIAGEGNPSACGMYAITNNVTLYAANLNLTANLVDGNICADGVDANTYTLTVTNTTGTAVNNVKVNVSIPAQWVNLVSVASGSGYANGVWTIGKMNESETKTLTLTLKSDIDLTNLSETATLQAFVSQLESATWTTYAASPFNASNNMTVVAQTQVPTDVTPYDACTTPGTLVYADLVKVAHPENLTFYETATSTTPVESMSTNSAVSKYVYFTYEEDGKCTSERGKVKISISLQPTAQVTSPETQRVCAAEKHTFTISAVAANGYGSWSIVSGEASIANPDALTTTACVVAGQTAVLAWNVVNEKNCKATATTTLIVDKEPVVTIVDGKGSQKACGPTEFKVAVNPNVPVGSWQIVSGTATIVSPTNYETKITGVGDNKTVKVRYETGAYGQCASVKGPEISLTVNALPTAAFTTSSSVICASTADPTKAQVTFTGASPYELTYQVDEGTAITKTGLTSPYTIKEQMSASGTLQLVSVKDANGCVGTITGQNHTVVADYFPTIQDITKPATICEGNALSLTAPSVETNGSTLGASGWVLNGASFDPSTILSANQDAQDLKYSVAYTCGRQAQSTIYSNVVSIAVDANPSAAVAGAAQTQCNNGTFTLAATAPAVGEGTWTLTSGTGTIADASSATSQVTDVPVNGSATLKWTVSNGVCPATNSSVVLTNNDCTNLNLTAGAAPVVCDGSQATFTFTLKNGSPVASTNVTATITLGAGLSDVDVTSSMGSVSGNTWTIPSMASGEQAVLTVLATATTANATVSVVVNEASSVAVTGVQASQTATVNALPTAAFQSNRSEVCADAAELTNAQVTFTGASAYELTYKVNDGAAITKTGLTSPYTIEEQLDANGTLQLVSVKDANGCVGTITGQNHTVVADYFPTIQDITKPATICEGNALSLTAPSVAANGSTLGTAGWVLNGASFDPSTILSANQDAQDLKYSVAYTCGRQAQSTVYSNVVSIAVDANPSAAVAGAAQTQCNNGTFTLAATAPAVGEGTWTLTSGSGTIADASSATSQVTDVPVNGSATLKWTVSNGVCPATNSSVVLTNNDCTNLNLTAGAAPVVCDGSQATFTFTLKNGSPVASTNVTATITMGAGLSDVDVTPSMGSVSGNTWTIPSMASGEQAVLTVLATATTANATVSVVVNEASSVAVTGVQASQSATVNALPTAAFQSNSSTICIDPQDKELTNIAVNFTGAAPFELTYVDSKGSTYVENNLPLSATLLNADLDADEAYTLVSVTDANGCVGTITSQTHQVSTQKHASLDVLVAPAPVCEGNTLTLVAPAVINNNGAIVSNKKWFLDGREFDATTSVTHDVHDGKALFYQITSSCNAIERNIASNSVDVTVYKTPELTVAFADPKGNAVTATQITCAVPYLTATLSGAESYTWSDGSTDNPRTLGKKGVATTYEVSGVTAAGCVSAPLTFTVTEDFVVPDVTLSSSNADNILTCSVTEITLTASSNTAGVTYQWDDANATTGANLVVSTPNTYKVTATNPSNGCYAAAVQTIGINNEYPIASIAVVNANGEATQTITCTDTELTLTPSVSNEAMIGAPVNFVWADDATLDAQRGVTNAGRYTVMAKGANGCEASVFVDIALDDNVPDLTLTASADTLTCAEPVVVLQASVTTLQGVTYVWNTQAAQDSIHVRLGGEYSVTATAPNGCQKEASIIIEQRTDEPAVVITAADPKQYCRVNTLTADGAVSYVWSTNETTTSIETSAGGMYWVEGTNRYGCTSRVELELEEDKLVPAVKITKDIESITCINPTAVLTAEVTNNADETRAYTYQWSPQAGANSTLSVTEGNTYKVVVTDQTNYCVGEATLKVEEHVEIPVIDVQTLPAVCLPATINLTDAVGPNTLADNVVFFEDEALTKEITNTTIDLAQYNVFYVQGQQVNGNGCMGDAQPVAANVKAVTPAPIVKDYDECTKVGSEKFSSLVTSGYYKLNFYASENDEAPIADAFDASASNTTTTYYVSNTNQGACESERVPFTVHIEGLVDFEMEVSETEIMIGDDPVTITLIPSSVDVEGYRWMANGKELQVEGDEYTVPVYVDTQFEIAASGRCNSLTQEASVVVNWPTAFTPYNNNGMNETFAKGLPVLIFNRFGIQVFEGADGWDGVMNKNMGANVMAVPGVYYYAVSLPDGNVKKGTIEIVKF